MFSIILFLVSVFCIIYYGIVISYSGLHTSFSKFWLFAAMVSAFFAVWIQSDFYQGLPNFISTIIHCIFIGFLAFFLIILCKILSCRSENVKNADYLIVLGARVKGNKPSKALEERIRTAYDYLSENENTIAILSGYRNAYGKVSQGKCMQRELHNMGISVSRLMIEGSATSTVENIRFSKEYMFKDDPFVVIVTSDFHLYRALKIARKNGLKNVKGIGAKTPTPLIVHSYVKEVFSVIKSWF